MLTDPLPLVPDNPYYTAVTAADYYDGEEEPEDEYECDVSIVVRLEIVQLPGDAARHVTRFQIVFSPAKERRQGERERIHPNQERQHVSMPARETGKEKDYGGKFVT